MNQRSNRLVIFWYEVVVLVALGWLAWAFLTKHASVSLLPPTLGIMPTGILWYGALGGVLISLTGVHEHRYDWDERFWPWYVTRPIIGATVATVAVLALQSGVLAIGASLPTASEGTPQHILYYLVAFVTGYRESTFRDLVKRLADVLFTSKETAAAPVIEAVTPKRGAAGAEVTIAGSGLSGVQLVRFGGVEAPSFRVASDGELHATVPAPPAGPPVEAVDVTVQTGTASRSARGAFTYEA